MGKNCPPPLQERELPIDSAVIGLSQNFDGQNLCFQWTCYKSLSRKKQEKEKKRERLVILGMLINIHEQSSLASIFKNDEIVVNCFIEA